MPTAAERQALVFLAALAVVGAGARVAASRHFEREVARAANDSGQQRDGARGLDRQIAAVDSARGRRAPKGSSARARKPTLSRGGRRDPPEPIDVNSAPADQLERLPRVGPALAKRIVDYREQHGPFAGMDDLRHVRGIGVTTAASLEGLVTFSSGYRPFHSESRPSGRDLMPSAN